MTDWRGRVAAIAFLAALLSNGGARACLLGGIYPDNWQSLSSEQRQEYFLRRDFANAELVFEAEIDAVTRSEKYVLVRLHVRRFFKSDGQPVELLWWPTDISCSGLNFTPKVATRVILFGHRNRSLFARNYLAERASPMPRAAVVPLHATDHVLTAGPADAYSKDDLAVVTYLDSLSPIRVSLPRAAQKP